MPRPRVHHSNDLDTLLEHLGGRLRAAPLPPLEPETVIVPSQGMARWLTLGLARRHGVCADLTTPFPATFVHNLADRVLPACVDRRGQPDPFDPEILTWRLFALLGDVPGDDVHAPLRRYLGGPGDARKHFQLAARLAGAFERYQLARPDWLRAWQRGEDAPTDEAPHPHAPWQARLWQRLRAGTEALPPVARLDGLLEHLAGRDPGLPLRRLSVFGTSHLPPAFLVLLEALAGHREVAVYLLSPTPHDRRLGGHPLLDTLDLQGREMQEVLTRRWPELEDFDDRGYRTPEGDQLLHRVQREILELDDRSRDDDVPPPVADDPSLRVHRCHTRRREVELLRDELLRAFAEIDDLEPADVLVLVPDVDDYAHHLEAVLGREDGAPGLPIALADRTALGETPRLAAFLELLEVARGRLDAPSVLGLLQDDALRRAFGFALADLEALRSWVEATRLRWGVDGAWRERTFGVPAVDDHSWREGLDRLLLGLCTGPRDDEVVGLVPAGDGTGGRAAVLGRLGGFAEALFDLADALRRPRSLADWSALLLETLDGFFAAGDDDEEEALQCGRELAGTIAVHGTAAGLGDEVPFEVVLDHLRRMARRAGRSPTFLDGRIPCAALVPLRSLPFRVIAVAGLDGDAFPRRHRPLPFDLLGRHRRGDRTARGDDRQLFLETLLAARDRLILTWCGHDPRDGSERPPSVVVEELLEHLERRSPGTRERVLQQEPMHGHAGALFAPEAPRSFSESGCEGARAETGPVLECRFQEAELLPVDDEGGDLALDDLVAFWRHPQRFFCRRAGLHVPYRIEPVPETEPFEPDALERYQLQQTMLDLRLQGTAQEDEGRLLRARGLLPHGSYGTVAWRTQEHEVAPLARTLGAVEPLPPLEVDVRGGGWRLRGVVDGLTANGRAVGRAADVKPKDRLTCWIHHAVLALHRREGGDGPPVHSELHGRKGSRKYGEVDDPRAVLDVLVEGYRQGLRRPLPFFEQSSEQYAGARQNKTREALEDELRRQWHEQEHGKGDGVDPHVRTCFRDEEPFTGAAFRSWATRVWDPLRAVEEEEKKR